MKNLTKEIIIIFLGFFLFSASSAHAVDFLLGGKAWYANWDPSMKAIGETFPNTGYQHMEEGSGMMYGPTIGVIITNNLSISITYLYGNLYSKFDKKWNSDVFGDRTLNDMNGNITSTRQDLDSVISYRFARMFRCFIGYKYQPIESKVRRSGTKWNLDDPNRDQFYKEDTVMDLLFQGPAAGIGFSKPFYSDFAFTANLSMLYLFGGGDINIKEEVYYASTFRDREYKRYSMDVESSGYGINFEPSVLCLVKENIILVLGFRYQYTLLDWEITLPGVGSNSVDEAKDHYYGASFSVMYKI